MANATSEIKITEYAANAMRYVRRYTVTAGQTIYRGTLVYVSRSTGLATTSTNDVVVIGIAENTATGGEKVDAITGLFEFDMTDYGEDPLNFNYINRLVSVYDNHTVQHVNGSNLMAGVLRFIAENGRAVVEVGNHFSN